MTDGPEHTAPSRLSAPLALLWTAVILTVCLVPTGSSPPDGIMLCLICLDDGTANLLLNVILYFPLGLLVRIRTGSLALAAGAGFLLSLGVETAQLWIPGRFTTLADLVANTLGAGMGGVLGGVGYRLVFPSAAAGRLLTPLAALCVALILAAPGPLVTRSVPAGTLYGNWTPRIAALAQYEGRLLAAEIGGIPLPSRALEDSDAVREAMAAGLPLTVHFEAGPPPPGRAPLFRLLNDQGAEALNLTVDGTDLLVASRIRAQDFYLARPGHRLRDALGTVAPGERVTAVMSWDSGGALQVTLTTPGPSAPAQADRLGVTSARGWSLLFSSTRLPRGTPGLVDFLWLAALFAPLGWWSGTVRRAAAAGALPLAVLLLIPAFSPLLPAPPAHFIAAILPLVTLPHLRAVAATRW